MDWGAQLACRELLRRAGVPEDGQWLAQVQAYERDVLSKRV